MNLILTVKRLSALKKYSNISEKLYFVSSSPLFKEERQLIFLKPYIISNMIYDYLYSINYIPLSRNNALFSKNSQGNY